MKVGERAVLSLESELSLVVALLSADLSHPSRILTQPLFTSSFLVSDSYLSLRSPLRLAISDGWRSVGHSPSKFPSPSPPRGQPGRARRESIVAKSFRSLVAMFSLIWGVNQKTCDLQNGGDQSSRCIQ